MESPQTLKRMREEDEDTEARDSLFDDSVDYQEEDDDEEEVALSEQESGMMENFISKVKRMCQLEDEIKEINASKKSLTDEKNDLRKEIITFMAAKDVGKVNYGEDEVLYIETRESSGSLNRKSLLNAIKSYHEVNDIQVSQEELVNLESSTQNRLHDAQDLYEFVNEFLGKETKVVLVREAKNKKKRARKQNTSLSVFN